MGSLWVRKLLTKATSGSIIIAVSVSDSSQGSRVITPLRLWVLVRAPASVRILVRILTNVRILVKALASVKIQPCIMGLPGVRIFHRIDDWATPPPRALDMEFCKD